MLVYNFKVVLPINVALNPHCLTTFQEEVHNVALRKALDMLPAIQGDAYSCLTLYKLRMAR